MKQWQAYLWKEWHQNKLLAWTGLGLFLLIAYVPILSELYQRGIPYHYDPDVVEGTVLWGGPMLAILLGVLAMGREQGKLGLFWRSRPVVLKNWFYAKYVTGLGLLLVICGITLGLNILIIVIFHAYGRTHLQASLALVEAYSFFLLLVYTFSFLMGILIYKPLNAMLLSLVGVAVMVLGPMVIKPLHAVCLDILRPLEFGSVNGIRYLLFIVTMTLLSSILLGFSYRSLHRRLTLICDQRVLWVSCILLVLVLAGSIAFPLGTNIPCQQLIRLPIAQHGGVTDMVTHGTQALVLFSDGPYQGSSEERKQGLVRVRIGPEKSTVEPPIWFLDPGADPNLFYGATNLMWSADEPNIAYVVVSKTRRVRHQPQRHRSLMTVTLDPSAANPVLHQLDLDPLLEDQYSHIRTSLYQGDIHLYVQRYEKNHHVQYHHVFSLENPQSPSYRPEQSAETPGLGLSGPGLFHDRDEDQYQLHLIADSSLNLEQRLTLTHQLAGYDQVSWVPLNRTQVLMAQQFGNMRLLVLSMDRIENSTIKLRPVGEYQAGPIQKLLNWGFGGKLLIDQSKLLECQGIIGLTVYDINDLKAIKRIGHYAAGDPFSSMALLDDGRVLLGGKKLHVLDMGR